MPLFIKFLTGNQHTNTNYLHGKIQTSCKVVSNQLNCLQDKESNRIQHRILTYTQPYILIYMYIHIAYANKNKCCTF